ncbi:MAG: DUF58 domain-containing protein [Verrucomicrobiae bacterium]|jgi:uncharacterized protein (DUF58 family)|nr:DUF58 domain-containing protein [Verrucomicrobiae bacterium]
MAAPEANPRAFLDPQALARLAHLPLVSRQAMEGSISGQHKSPHRGSSVEFAEYRGYVAGDDLRRLDWRVLGRTDRYFIKEFEADTNLRLHLLLDSSASMGFSGAAPRKFDCAQRIAATLAYLAARQGDATGLNCASEKHRIELPAKRSPAHLQTLYDVLETTEPAGATTLPAALHELAEKIRRRALVVVISDFFCPVAELKPCLQHLRFQKHDVAVFHLLDPLETTFEFDRPMRFQDLESPFNLVTEPALVRDLYLEEFNKHRAALRAGCLEFNVDYREVLTDANTEKILADFLTERVHAGGRR